MKKVKITEKQKLVIKEYYLNEANKTVCQTPDAQFHTKIEDKLITCTIDLPQSLNLSKDEAKILETNIHNAMELVLVPYFKK